MLIQKIVHFLLFVIFFSVGAGALGLAALCDDLIVYWRNERLVKEAHLSLDRLRSLNEEYDALLAELHNDPNLLRRLAPATLGTLPEDPNAVYPKARAQELAVARRALMDRPEQESGEPVLPKWLQRCSEPRHRLALFLAGADLVLISLVFFTPKADVADG
jgi:hypothetical protein